MKLQNELFLLHVRLKDVIFSELAGEEQRALDAIRVNPKFFYSYAKRFSKVRSNIGPLIGRDGCLTSNPQSMADILQTQYNSVFSDPANPNKVIPPLVKDLPQCITDISLTVEDIEEAIDDIRPNAGTTENDIPAVIRRVITVGTAYTAQYRPIPPNTAKYRQILRIWRYLAVYYHQFGDNKAL